MNCVYRANLSELNTYEFDESLILVAQQITVSSFD